jgi:hypothetical protein
MLTEKMLGNDFVLLIEDSFNSNSFEKLGCV